MNWFELIQPELLILVPFMYIMAYYLTLSKVSNRLIPFLMFLFSTVMVLLKYLFLDGQSFGGGISVVAVMQGAFLSMVVITGDQAIKTLFPKLLALLEPRPLTDPKGKAAAEPGKKGSVPTTEAVTATATEPAADVPVTAQKNSIAPTSEPQFPSDNIALQAYNNLIKKSPVKEALPAETIPTLSDDGE